jgi:hypothetical protein
MTDREFERGRDGSGLTERKADDRDDSLGRFLTLPDQTQPNPVSADFAPLIHLGPLPYILLNCRLICSTPAAKAFPLVTFKV